MIMALSTVLMQSEDDDMKFMGVRTLVSFVQGERKTKLVGSKKVRNPC